MITALYNYTQFKTVPGGHMKILSIEKSNTEIGLGLLNITVYDIKYTTPAPASNTYAKPVVMLRDIYDLFSTNKPYYKWYAHVTRSVDGGFITIYNGDIRDAVVRSNTVKCKDVLCTTRGLLQRYVTVDVAMDILCKYSDNNWVCLRDRDI